MLKASSRDPSKMESVVELYKTVTSMPPPPVPQKAQAEKVLEPGDLNSKKVTEDEDGSSKEIHVEVGTGTNARAGQEDGKP